MIPEQPLCVDSDRRALRRQDQKPGIRPVAGLADTGRIALEVARETVVHRKPTFPAQKAIDT